MTAHNDGELTPRVVRNVIDQVMGRTGNDVDVEAFKRNNPSLAAWVDGLSEAVARGDFGASGPQVGPGVWELRQLDGSSWIIVGVCKGAALGANEVYITKPTMPFSGALHFDYVAAKYPITIGTKTYNNLEQHACGRIAGAGTGTVLNRYSSTVWSGDSSGNNPTHTC